MTTGSSATEGAGWNGWERTETIPHHSTVKWLGPCGSDPPSFHIIVVVVAEGDVVAFGLNWESRSRRAWLGGAGGFVFGNSCLGGLVFGRYGFAFDGFVCGRHDFDPDVGRRVGVGPEDRRVSGGGCTGWAVGAAKRAALLSAEGPRGVL